MFNRHPVFVSNAIVNRNNVLCTPKYFPANFIFIFIPLYYNETTFIPNSFFNYYTAACLLAKLSWNPFYLV